MAYPILNGDAELFKKDDEVRELEQKTEKHDLEKILKSLRVNDEYCKKYESIKRKNVSSIFFRKSKRFQRCCFRYCFI